VVEPLIAGLFDAVPDALVVVDGSGRIACANRQATRLFGYDEGGLDGLLVEALIPTEARERHVHHRDAYMRAPRVRPMGSGAMNLVGRRLDGGEFPVEIALSPLRSDAGPMFLASVRDISETLRARQASTRSRLDALSAEIGQRALAVFDPAALIGSLPALLADALEVEQVAVFLLAGGHDPEVHFTHAGENDDAFQATADWLPLLAGTDRVTSDLSRDSAGFPAAFAAHGGSAAIVPLLDGATPIGALVARAAATGAFEHDAVHLLRSVALIVAAVLQRRRSEEQLAHAQRLDAIGQLTGGIAHDFNNLLTVMSGNLQLLQMACETRPGDEDLVELIESARRSAARGAELTAKLLSFARRQPLQPRALSSAQLMRDLERLLKRTLGSNIALSVDVPRDAPPVFADAAQLEAALVNLALNARDAMHRGGELRIGLDTVELDASKAPNAAAPGRYARFRVIDTGIGMSPDVMARAIEPFFTTKGQGRGSGLGLSMVYGFVRQSGGELRIASRLGYGTQVEVLLPVAPAAPSIPATPDVATTGKGVVLVVEDDPAVADVAAAFVASLGYRVRAVADAEAALAVLAGKEPIDIVFSDVLLGTGPDGVELATRARALRPGLPILLTSGHAASPTLEGVELLRKPYERVALGAALARAREGAARTG
jgi:PAS domain S-box-containing protein